MEAWFDTDDKGRRTRLIAWGGASVRVRDGADIAFRVMALWDDRGLDAATKLDIACRLLFCDPEKALSLENFEGLLVEAVAQVAGFDVRAGAEPPSDPVLDFERDEKIIYSSLFRAYGMPLETIAQQVTLDGLLALIAGVPFETPLGQALYYRTAEPPEPTRFNGDEVRNFRRWRDYWSLGDTSTDMDALFNSF